MKRILYGITIVAAIGLLLLFIAFCLKDTVYYNTDMNSAPLRVFYLVRAVEFALPAALCGGVAWLLKKK